MRLVAILLLLGGLALATVLVAWFGAGEIGRALLAVGWDGYALILLVHLLLIGVMGLAWLTIVPGQGMRAAPVFVWARLIRDSAAEVLPLSQIGGYVLGARAAVLHGIAPPMAAASTVIDVTMELAAQVAYAAIGLALLLRARPDAALGLPLWIGLLVGAGLTGLILAVERRGGLALLDRAVLHVAPGWFRALPAGSLHAAAEAIFARPGRLGIAFLLHLTEWLGSGAEAWLVLRLMHVPVSLAATLSLESLLYALRSLAFAVPNAIGVQEGAYVLLAGSFGLTPDQVLALSLVKRGRDVLLGVPALLVWQALEGRRAWRPGRRLGDPVPAAQSAGPRP